MSKLFVDEIKGNTGTTVTVPTGQKIAGTDTGSVYAPGMVIQTYHLVLSVYIRQRNLYTDD